MKYFKKLQAVSFLLLMVFGGYNMQAQDQKVPWISFEEAIAKTQSETTPKKIFIDIYTDWCGWCKRMDKDTFNNPDVAAYMTEKFYMVKLDGEEKENIQFNGKTFKFINSGRRGYHELAAGLMQGRMSYPTTVFMDEQAGYITKVPGYNKPKEFLKIAKYIGENIYKTKDWNTYNAGSK
ncbi:MAG: DUF255 domain-containing protein [Flavobacteriaceae bacterium]|nr:DUF255 domain-containing protein [Flavobacteriaceae bacterium]